MASCVAITAIICVLLTTVATIVSFSTPNWLGFESNSGTLCGCQTCDCGLWLSCDGGAITSPGSLDNCRWFFDDNYRVERVLPAWFKAVQGMMSVAIASCLLSLIIGMFSLCCECKGCNPNHAAAAFINLSFLLLSISVCVFGAKAHIDHSATVLQPQGVLDPVFGWSFWTAAGAAIMALISSVFYLCECRESDRYL